MQVMIESVDPVIAERILLPREQGQQKVVGEIQDMLAKGEKLPVDFTNRIIYYAGNCVVGMR